MNDRRSNEYKKNAVYQIVSFPVPCQYIVETEKTTKIRLQEYVRYVTNQNKNSEINKHRRDTGHLFDFENVNIISQEQKRKQREFINLLICYVTVIFI